MRNPEITKTTILEAAERILEENGVLALTIDEVAKCASISKGGVLHHFPNKEALVFALFQRELDRFEEDVERFRRQDPVMPGAYTRAYLRASAEELSAGTNHSSISCIDQFLNISAVRELVLSYSNRWQRRVEEDGLDPVVASLVRYASDGIWLVARVGSAKPATHTAVVRMLLDLAGATASATYKAPYRKRASVRTQT